MEANTKYINYMNLEDLCGIGPRVMIQDFILDHGELSYSEFKELCYMYGSLARAGWSVLKKKFGGTGVTSQMTELELKLLKILEKTTVGFEPDECLDIIDEALWHNDLKVGRDINTAIFRLRRAEASNVVDNFMLGATLVAGAGIYSSSKLIKGQDKKSKLARFSLRLGGSVLCIGSFVAYIYKPR